VANTLNQVELKEALPEILNYLREKLNNFVLTIELSISEQIREETVYTAQEKYDFLVKINPELKNLKETFDLDF
jgi:DNA polymerase-3 subunit gamma/tau